MARSDRELQVLRAVRLTGTVAQAATAAGGPARPGAPRGDASASESVPGSYYSATRSLSHARPGAGSGSQTRPLPGPDLDSESRTAYPSKIGSGLRVQISKISSIFRYHRHWHVGCQKTFDIKLELEETSISSTVPVTFKKCEIPILKRFSI